MADSTYCVYIHTTPSGKRYIGITKQSAERRWQGGLGYKKNDYFFNAIVKYGWANLKHEIYAQNLSQESAETIEKELVAQHKSKDRCFGYNHTDGGDGTKGYTPSLETREKMSQSHTGEKSYWFGKHWSEETRAKMSKTYKDNFTEEFRTKLSNAHKNQHPSEETKAKQSEFMMGNQYALGKKLSETRKADISEFMRGNKYTLGCKLSEEHKAKISKARKGIIFTEEHKSNMSAAKTKQRDVYQYSLEGELIKVWKSTQEIRTNFRLGKESANVYACANGDRPNAYGFIWSYNNGLKAGD